MYFEWIYMNFDFSDLLLMVKLRYSSIGWDYGLVPTRRQAIMLTHDDKFTDAYMCYSVSMS